MDKPLIYILVEMPVGTVKESLSPEAMEDVAFLQRIHPGSPMPGTQEHNGNMIHMTVARVEIDLATVQGLIAKHSLPWNILGMQDVCCTYTHDGDGERVMHHRVQMPLDSAALWPYMLIPTDDDGNEITPGQIQLSEYRMPNAVPMIIRSVT